jgi:uncharacterized protein (DUF3084 family)
MTEFEIDVLKKRIVELEKLNAERKKVEDDIKRARQELELKIRDLERFQKVTMGRESRIIELKEEVRRLKAELGKK